MKHRTPVRIAACLTLAVALVGCGSGDETTDAQGGETHVMPDGTVMKGKTHVHDDSHSHGEESAPEDSGSDASTGPSQAARMVCSGQVVADVTRILGLDEKTEPSSSWTKPDFRCAFDTPGGPLVLTVHDADDESAGEQHFQRMQSAQAGARPIKGVSGLGLPAYETPEGITSFVKDGKTLTVDASRLTGRDGRLGTEQDMTRSEIAYAVASSVLTCWTEHGTEG